MGIGDWLANAGASLATGGASTQDRMKQQEAERFQVQQQQNTQMEAIKQLLASKGVKPEGSTPDQLYGQEADVAQQQQKAQAAMMDQLVKSGHMSPELGAILGMSGMDPKLQSTVAGGIQRQETAQTVGANREKVAQEQIAGRAADTQARIKGAKQVESMREGAASKRQESAQQYGFAIQDLKTKAAQDIENMKERAKGAGNQSKEYDKWMKGRNAHFDTIQKQFTDYDSQKVHYDALNQDLLNSGLPPSATVRGFAFDVGGGYQYGIDNAVQFAMSDKSPANMQAFAAAAANNPNGIVGAIADYAQQGKMDPNAAYLLATQIQKIQQSAPSSMDFSDVDEQTQDTEDDQLIFGGGDDTQEQSTGE